MSCSSADNGFSLLQAVLMCGVDKTDLWCDTYLVQSCDKCFSHECIDKHSTGTSTVAHNGPPLFFICLYFGNLTTTLLLAAPLLVCCLLHSWCRQTSGTQKPNSITTAVQTVFTPTDNKTANSERMTGWTCYKNKWRRRHVVDSVSTTPPTTTCMSVYFAY